MIDSFAIYNDLKKSLGDEAAAKMARIIQGVYEELSQAVTREDFNELKAVVGELAEAQRRTEERLDNLAVRVEELAEAQKRTEARVEELAEAQKRTEERVEELAEAQKKTEQRLDSLTERVEELAEAQKRTETRLEKLIGEHKKTREMLGGLSHTVGYRLEDEAIWALPDLLKKDFGIEVVGRLSRGFIETAPGRYMEVNIWGEARKDGRNLVIFGEARSQLKKRDVTDFHKKVNHLKNIVNKDIFPILVTYQTSPMVQQTAQEKGIKIYFSYELRPTRS